MYSTIYHVLLACSYGERIQELSQAFKDRPVTPSETVVYWTEYILRHNGTCHLRPVSADMPLYTYFLLDVILFYLFIGLAIALALYFLLNRIFICFLF